MQNQRSSSTRIDIARFERLVVVTRGHDHIALTYEEAAELKQGLAEALGERPVAQPEAPVEVRAVREFLNGKERAQGPNAIQRHLRTVGVQAARDTGFVARLLEEALSRGAVRLTGSGRYALP